MNRVLDNFFNRESSYGTDWRPVVDVAETESDIIVKAEIPGIDPEGYRYLNNGRYINTER